MRLNKNCVKYLCKGKSGNRYANITCSPLNVGLFGPIIKESKLYYYANENENEKSLHLITHEQWKTEGFVKIS